jgi:hypothetical protein
MTNSAVKWLMIANITVCLNTLVSAKDLDAGKHEFLSSCANCHGEDGKGKGRLSELLKIAPADLTVLAKKNNGVFPANAIYETLYGIKEIVAHGTRAMPIWGYRYTVPPNELQSPKKQPNYKESSYDPAPIVRTRTLAVIRYLNRIQEK